MHSLQTFPPLRQHRSACFDPSANQKHRTPHFPLSCHFILSISFRETLFSTSRGVATISDKTRSLPGTCEIGRFSAHTRSVRRKFCDKIKSALSRERELAMFSLALKPGSERCSARNNGIDLHNLFFSVVGVDAKMANEVRRSSSAAAMFFITRRSLFKLALALRGSVSRGLRNDTERAKSAARAD